MSSLWLLVGIVPLAAAAGWCGRGSRADRWLTMVLCVITVHSALRLVWATEYAQAVFLAAIMLGSVLWGSRPLQHDTGDGDGKHEADDGGERGDGDGRADARPYRPRPFK